MRKLATNSIKHTHYTKLLMCNNIEPTETMHANSYDHIYSKSKIIYSNEVVRLVRTYLTKIAIRPVLAIPNLSMHSRNQHIDNKLEPKLMNIKKHTQKTEGERVFSFCSPKSRWGGSWKGIYG